MTTDPAAALKTLGTIDLSKAPSSAAWEVSLLTARAASMGGAAFAGLVAPALDKAWAEAPRAALVDGAAARVAGDRAALAGRTGDRAGLVSMLAVDRYGRGANEGQAALAADLPLCGADGITPQDRVIIDVAKLPAFGRPKMTLVWASRPGIARPFLAAAERSGAVAIGEGQAAILEMACRVVPSTDYAVRNTLEESIGGWMTSQGAYPLSDSDGGSNPSQIASMIAQREARYGPTSLMLLPVLVRNMSLSAAGMFGDQSARKQASESIERVAAILIANHAPADLTTLVRASAIGLAVMAQTKTPAEGQAQVQALLIKAASDPDLSWISLTQSPWGRRGCPTCRAASSRQCLEPR